MDESKEWASPLDRDAWLAMALPERTRGSRIPDLVEDALGQVVEVIGGDLTRVDVDDPEAYGALLDGLEQRCQGLMRMIVAGVTCDPDGLNDEVWIRAVHRLVAAGTSSTFGAAYRAGLREARLFPALLILTTVGLASRYIGRDELLIKTAMDRSGSVQAVKGVPLCQTLHPRRVIRKTTDSAAHPDPRYVTSERVMSAVGMAFGAAYPLGGHFEETYHSYEYRMAILHEYTCIHHELYMRGAQPYETTYGGFVKETGWMGDEQLAEEIAFRGADHDRASSPWRALLGDEYDEVLERVRERHVGYRRHEPQSSRAT